MPRIDEPESRSKSPMTAILFLNSIKTWYADAGIHVAVDSISKPQETDREDRVALAFNLAICEDMPKCRARVIGDDGEVVKIGPTKELCDEYFYKQMGMTFKEAQLLKKNKMKR